MDTKLKYKIRAACHAFGGGALLIAFTTQAQNLFVADDSSGSITEITPSGAQSTFASGFETPYSLAFQPVPEPSVLGLLGFGAAALMVYRRKLIV